MSYMRYIECWCFSKSYCNSTFTSYVYYVYIVSIFILYTCILDLVYIKTCVSGEQGRKIGQGRDI